MPKRTRSRGRPPHDDVLTPTEWRTLHALQHGLSKRELAHRRDVSADAVKYHVRNIRQKLGLDAHADVRDGLGVPRDSRLAGENFMTTPTQLGAIGQIARSVNDIDVSIRWYRDVLGLPHLYTYGKLAFFDCGGTRLMLTAEHGAKPDESILYLRAPDIRAAHRDLSERGVEFMGAPHMIHKHPDGTEEWMAFFKDTEGRVLAIMSQI